LLRCVGEFSDPMIIVTGSLYLLMFESVSIYSFIEIAIKRLKPNSYSHDTTWQNSLSTKLNFVWNCDNLNCHTDLASSTTIVYTKKH
jgi:hypothetical protein